MKKNAKTLIFLHVPKTAGTTFRNILLANYPREHVFPIYGRKEGYYHLSDIEKLSASERARIRMVWGHFFYGIHENLVGPWRYLTFLRDPVERVISFYQHILINPHHGDWKRLTENRIDVVEFARDPAMVNGSNAQTYLIAGVPPGKGAGKAALEKAKRNLERDFEAVGLTERFDESLAVFGRRFGWHRLGYRRLNVNDRSPRKAGLPERQRRMLEKLNTLDRELYRFAETLFEKQLKVTSGIVKQAADLKRKNRRRRPPPERVFDRNNIVNTLRKKNRLPVELWFWANRFLKRGRLEESREWFRKVLALDSTPDHLRYEACVSLGDIARKLGRRGAENWYRRALELCFNEPALPDWKIYRAGSAYRKMGKDDLALPYFRKLAETAGLAHYLAPGTFFHLGEILRKQGEARGARRCFRKCLAREPAHRKAKEYLERENGDKTKAA